MSFKDYIPWWFKICAKIVLSRLSLSYTYRFWQKLNLFKHGKMHDPEYALHSYETHLKTSGIDPVRHASSGFTVLEIGPGDTAFTALIAKAFGASKCWLIDAGDFAVKDIQAYHRMAAYLKSKNYHVPFEANLLHSFQEILMACNCDYLTDGVKSFSKVPSQSVDYCFSNAVLEHIPKQDFMNLITELRRVLKPTGISVHRVDLKDHLGGGLNNLRFSDTIWETKLFRTSGFYTNRLRCKDIIHLFLSAGFEVIITRKTAWEKLPIKRTALAKEFKHMPDEELLISGFDILLYLK